jgi:hypothetical protein
MNKAALTRVASLVAKVHDDDECEQQRAGMSNLLMCTEGDLAKKGYFLLPYEGLKEHAWGIPQFAPANFPPVHWPEKIKQQTARVQRQHLSGLFPEIGRAWAIVDNRLYLWAFDSNCEVEEFQHSDHLIVSVALVPARRGVFIDDVQYVLVVATTIEIVLVAISIGAGHDVISPIELYATPYAVPTDGVFVLHVVGTATGRIFLGGNDGVVYEVEYSGESSWRNLVGLPNQCRKVDKSSSAVAKWVVPQFLRDLVYPDDPIHQLVVDNGRNLLYTLTKKNIISLYALGSDGESMTFIHRVNAVDAAKRASRFGAGNGERYFKALMKTDKHVISLHPLPVTDTRRKERCADKDVVHMIAVCADGARLYFTTLNAKGLKDSKQRLGAVETATTLALLPKGFTAVRGRPRTVPTRAMRANRQITVDGKDDPLFLGVAQPSKAFQSDDAAEIVKVAYCDRDICITAEGPRRQSLSAESAEVERDTLTSLCFDIGHHRLGNAGKNDDTKVLLRQVDNFLPHRRLGQENDAYLENLRNKYTDPTTGRPPYSGGQQADRPSGTLKESVHHHEPEMGRVTDLCVLRRPETRVDDYLRMSPRPMQKNHRARLGNPGLAGQKRERESPAKSVAISLGPLATQHLDPTVQFLCLTTQGVVRYELLRPVEQLRRILNVGLHGTQEQHLFKFLCLYGRAETCAMCLTIICSLNKTREDGTVDDVPCDIDAPLVLTNAPVGNAGNVLGSNTYVAQRIVQSAERVFFDARYSGSPCPGGLFRGGGQRLPRRPQMAYGGAPRLRGGVEPVWSGRREGIARYFSRIVRPFWDWTIAIDIPTDAPVRLGPIGFLDRADNMARAISSGRSPHIWKLRFDLNELKELHEPVERLRKFMEVHAVELCCDALPAEADHVEVHGVPAIQSRSIARIASTPAQNSRQIEAEEKRKAKTKEDLSLAELYHTVTRCAQALAALRMLALPQSKFFELVEGCARKDELSRQNLEVESVGEHGFLQSLSTLTFKNLVTEPVGAEVMKNLLLELLSASAVDADIRGQSRGLTRQCPMFFSACTELMSQGNRFLKRALEPVGARERQDLLDGALEQFVNASEELELHPDRHMVKIIKIACDKFNEVTYYDGVVTLSLAAAHYLAEGQTKRMPPGYDKADGSERALEDAGDCVVVQGTGSHANKSAKAKRLTESDIRLNLRKNLYLYLVDDFYLPLMRKNLAAFELLLGRAQKYDDAWFHHELYYKLMHEGGGNRRHLFERLQSQHVRSFLLRMIEEISNGSPGKIGDYYDSLTSHYVHIGEQRAAARILYRRAKEEDVELEKNPRLATRLGWLNRAIVLASSAIRVFSQEQDVVDSWVDADSLRDWEDDLDVAKAQMMLLERHKTEAHGGADDAVRKELEYKLLDCTRLYTIASRCGYRSLCLKVIEESGNTDIDDRVKHDWLKILYRDVFTGNVDKLVHLEDRASLWVKQAMGKIQQVCVEGPEWTWRNYVVPVDFFISLFEELLRRYNLTEYARSVIKLLRTIQMPWMEIILKYNGTHESQKDFEFFVSKKDWSDKHNQPPQHEGNRDIHFSFKIAECVIMWIEEARDSAAPQDLNDLYASSERLLQIVQERRRKVEMSDNHQYYKDRLKDAEDKLTQVYHDRFAYY